MTTVTSQEFISPEQLAELLSLPLSTIYGWRYRGEGPRGIRVGRHVRFRKEDVEAWLEEKADPRSRER